MERSADFVDWTVVASWSSPQPGAFLAWIEWTWTVLTGPDNMTGCQDLAKGPSGFLQTGALRIPCVDVPGSVSITSSTHTLTPGSEALMASVLMSSPAPSSPAPRAHVQGKFPRARGSRPLTCASAVGSASKPVFSLDVPMMLEGL